MGTFFTTCANAPSSRLYALSANRWRIPPDICRTQASFRAPCGSNRELHYSDSSIRVARSDTRSLSGRRSRGSRLHVFDDGPRSPFNTSPRQSSAGLENSDRCRSRRSSPGESARLHRALATPDLIYEPGCASTSWAPPEGEEKKKKKVKAAGHEPSLNRGA